MAEAGVTQIENRKEHTILLMLPLLLKSNQFCQEISPTLMIKRPWPVTGTGFQICQKTKHSYMGLLGHSQTANASIEADA